MDASGPDVDVVLLDRRMPTVPGDRALEAIREQEGTAGVAMMTAVSPDEAIVEMDYDAYLRKPVDRDTVVRTVEALRKRAGYPPEIRTLFRLRAMLETPRTVAPDDPVENDRYRRLSVEFERRYRESVFDEYDDCEAEKLATVVDR